MEELLKIQSELKAPKGQFNSSGKYHYRSCEDILEAVKPLLRAAGCTLSLCDEIVQVGERYYVKSTARIANAAGRTEQTSAYAREDERKAGMDGAQITGSASSYARKYALNGLFCIDDTKDPDTDKRKAGAQARTAPKPPQTAPAAPVKKRITPEMLADEIMCDSLLKWAYNAYTTSGYSQTFDAGAKLLKSYDADADVVERFTALFESYRQARKNAK